MPLVRHRQIPIPASDTEGYGIQETLAREVKREMGWALVTGVDVAYAPTKNKHEEMAYAVAVTVSTSNWRPVDIQRWKGLAPMA